MDLVNVFEVRPLVMKTVPFFLRGTFKTALKASLQEIRRGQHEHDDTTEIRGWKLFFLLPRILLHRPPRGGLVPKAQLQERVDKFLQGQWVALLETSLELSIQGAAASCRRRRGQKDTIERRAARAFELCQLGELSSARQALEGAAIAPGDSRTEKLLKDETRRPRVVRTPIDRSILEAEPEEGLNLDVDALLQNLRTARRGAAAGPSGMTAEHPFLLIVFAPDSLERWRDSSRGV